MREMETERALLVGAGNARHVKELARLAGTLGLEVAGIVEQNRRDGTGYLGKGKRGEAGELARELGASFVVADDELTASQSRVLERDTGVSVVDRTELIIRIFEAHASDRASRMEVELADLEYRLPRVKGRNPALSRLGGGGRTTRGPGEQQLEYDRRAIRERMDTINRKLKHEKTAREVRGARLKKGGPPSVTLVGYTNAGKTTILNALSGAGRSTRDWLFETLETTTRLVEGNSSSKPDFVVTDTVGFIRKLPAQLVHSFASTLEAGRGASIQILCADASSDDLDDEIRTVRETISDLFEENGALEQTTILCLNKIDLVSASRLERLRADYPDAVMVSAIESAEPLIEAIYEAIAEGRERMELLIPHAEYGAASRLYGRAEVHSSKDTTEGVLLDVTLPRSVAGKYANYRVS